MLNADTMSSVENSVTIEQKSIKSVQSDNSKEGIYIANLSEQLCLDYDMDSLPKISMSVVYPQFYEE